MVVVGLLLGFTNRTQMQTKQGQYKKFNKVQNDNRTLSGRNNNNEKSLSRRKTTMFKKYN